MAIPGKPIFEDSAAGDFGFRVSRISLGNPGLTGSSGYDTFEPAKEE